MPGEGRERGIAFALWLLPAAGERKVLKKVIDELARRYGATPFEPHVTLYSGTRLPGDPLEKAVGLAASRIAPFPLKVEGIGYGDGFLKALFMVLGAHPSTATLSREACASLALPRRYELKPHLSLLYRLLSERERREAAASLRIGAGELHFDAVAVVSPGAGGDWTRVGDWRRLLRRRLGG